MGGPPGCHHGLPGVSWGVYPALLLLVPHLILMTARCGEEGLDLQGEETEQAKSGEVDCEKNVEGWGLMDVGDEQEGGLEGSGRIPQPMKGEDGQTGN